MKRRSQRTDRPPVRLEADEPRPCTQRAPRWAKPSALLVGAVVALAAVPSVTMLACSGPGSKNWASQAKGADKKRRALQVKTTALEPADIEHLYRTSGTLQALRTADIVAVQMSVIKSVAVEEGDIVKRGDVLARLDGRELSLQASSARLQLKNLTLELERLKSAGHGTISSEEIDKQRYAVEEARASAKLSQHQAKQTVVRAPFDGTITSRYIDAGNLATTASPLFRVEDLSQLELELHVPERDAASVASDAEVLIELVDGSTFTAAITRRAPIVEALTGTVKFTIRAATFPATAKPGAFARAQIIIHAVEDAPSLPRSATFEVEGKTCVFVLRDGKASRTQVEVGLEGGERVEVKSGLVPTDVVVTDGNAGITEGMPLRSIDNVPSTPASPSD